MNVIIWGFADIASRQAIFRLINNHEINLKKWFLIEKYKEEFYGLAEAEYAFTRFLKNYEGITLENMPLDIVKYIDNNTRILEVNFARDMYFYGKPSYELLNVIHIVSRYYYTVLKNNDVQLVMFGDVPHNGWMLTLYYVAKAMKIKTFFCGSTRIDNHFVGAFSLDDFGTFKEVPEYNPSIKKVVLKEKIENNWFDMSEEWLKEASHENVEHKWKAFIKPSEWLRERKKIITDNNLKYGGWKRILQKKIVETIGRKFDEINYKKSYNNNVLENVDLSVPYVYYPFHLQPEMTTDVLGGMYTNQMLLLEQLSELIPDNWVIYAKEHPLQNSYMRGEYFFKQLSLLPKVKLVSNKMDTYELNRYSKFVATLVGTTGWEAISGGKNALVFGQAWYGSLPGVFHYHQGITLDEIMDYKIDHDEFEQAVSKLMRKMGKGIVSDDQIPSIPNFDVKRNNENVYDFLSFIVNYVDK